MNFYYQLRTKTAKRPTTIYAIISNEGKQYKVATEYKILPTLWDGSMAIISTYNNVETNQANIELNAKLNDFKVIFYKKFANFAASNEMMFDDVINSIKSNSMARRRNENKLSAKALLNLAFNELAEVNNWKESSQKKNYSMLRHILDYVESETANKSSSINLDMVDGYFKHIQSKAPQTIKDRMCLLLKLINDILSVETKYKEYSIKPIAKKYKVSDNRGDEEKKSCALNDEQVKAIKDVELTTIEDTVRNLFLLDILIGQRWSDWAEVINTIDLNSKDGFWSYTPTKENKKFVKATIHVTDEVKAIITTLREDKNLNEVLGYSTAKINATLKKIASKANLTTSYTYYKAKGNDSEKVVTTLDKVISSHWGRHTFITNMLLQGYTPSAISKMSGHADSTMIEKVYSHNREETAKRIILKEKKQLEKASSKEETTDKVEEYKKVLTMFNVPPIEWIELNDEEELFRIILKYETEFANKLEWDYKKIKDLFNNKEIPLKTKMLSLQQALTELNK